MSRKKKEYPPTLDYVEEDVIEAAAWFNGEGSFGVYGGYAQVQLGQNEKEPLIKLRDRFGGIVHFAYVTKAGSNHYYWRMRNMQAINFMLLIYDRLTPSRVKQFESAMQGLNGNRDYEKPVTDEGVSLDYLESKLKKHTRGAKQTKSKPMSLFGLEK